MNNVNWGLISNGFEFQALCGSLLGLEYSTIEQFSAPGPDKGVDAFLSTGSVIFQYKFHKEPTLAKIKQDALAEFSKIPGRKLKENRYWPFAKKWILVANIEASPQLREMWETEIVPKFKELNLTAELVTREQLEKLLAQHPSIRQAYFEKMNRTFITLNEVFERLKSQRIQDRDIENKYFGRDAELDAFREFLEDANKLLLLVTGPGGVGKSRFLLECAKVAATEKQLSVYWANIETMQSSSHWIDGIPSGNNVVLFIDEPNNPQIVQVLLEQIQTKGSVFSRWKLIIAVRSQNSSIITVLSSKRDELQRTSLELQKLGESNLTSIAEELLSNSPVAQSVGPRIKEVSSSVAKISQGFPIWTVIAAQLIQEKGSFTDISKDGWGIAKTYVEQAIKSIPEGICSQKQAKIVLDWLGLLGEIHIEDQKVIGFLKSEINVDNDHEVIKILDTFSDRKVIQKAGRIRRIKPDVIRDYLLLSLLVSEQSENAVASRYSIDLCKRILEDNGPIPYPDRIIGSLNHIELLQKLNGNPVGLLAPIIFELKSLAAKDDAIQQYSALKLAKKFAYSQPKELLNICRTIRLTPAPPSEISDPLWGKKIIEHKTNLLELPWAILEAARYALEKGERLMIIEELVHLAEFERTQSNQSPIQPNDGKRSWQVLEKIIFNGSGFYIRFDREAEVIANKIINSWEGGKQVSVAEGYALRCLVRPLISVERENIHFEKGVISINRYAINPDGPVSEIRTGLLEKLWSLLTETTHEQARLVILDLLQDNHHSVARVKSQQGANIYEKESLNDLDRIQEFLTKSWVTGAELRQAKQLWDWHLNYDRRGNYKKLAKQCEKKFLSRPNSDLFSWIFGWSHQPEDNIKDAVRKLVQQVTKDPGGKLIEKMISQALDFAGKDKFFHNASLISRELGKVILSSPAVSAFTWENIGSANQNIRAFAAAILSEYLRSLRETDNMTEQAQVLQKAKTLVGKNELYSLMLDLYSRARLWATEKLNSTDQTFFRSNLSEILPPQNRSLLIEVAARFLPLGFDHVKTDINTCL